MTPNLPEAKCEINIVVLKQIIVIIIYIYTTAPLESPCPASFPNALGYFEIGHKSYKFYDSNVTFQEAIAQCSADGGYLNMPQDPNEKAAVEYLIGKS